MNVELGTLNRSCKEKIMLDTLKNKGLVLICGTVISVLIIHAHAESVQTGPEPYNVVWNSPSKDFNGSMPIGNGDIGANVWVEQGGDLLFYISKTDAWSENARLLKLGRIRIRLTPNPFASGSLFQQELDLKNGVIKIRATPESIGNEVDLNFWIDANNPVIRITGKASNPIKVEVMLEHWRTERQEVAKGDRSFTGLFDRDTKSKGFAYPLFVEPDTIVDTKEDSMIWYHRNRKSAHSVWEDTLNNQGLGGFIEKSDDPLLNLTFGALVEGKGLVRTSSTKLQSAKPSDAVDISVFPLTAQTATAKQWSEKVKYQAVKYKGKHSAELHTQPVDEFLKREHIT